MYFWFLSFYISSIYISEISDIYKVIIILATLLILFSIYLYQKFNTDTYELELMYQEYDIRE